MSLWTAAYRIAKINAIKMYTVLRMCNLYIVSILPMSAVPSLENDFSVQGTAHSSHKNTCSGKKALKDLNLISNCKDTGVTLTDFTSL